MLWHKMSTADLRHLLRVSASYFPQWTVSHPLTAGKFLSAPPAQGALSKSLEAMTVSRDQPYDRVLRYTAQLSTHGDPVLDDLVVPTESQESLRAESFLRLKDYEGDWKYEGLDGFDTPLDPEDIQQESIHMRRKGRPHECGGPQTGMTRDLSPTTPRTAFCQQPE